MKMIIQTVDRENISINLKMTLRASVISQAYFNTLNHGS